MNWKQIEAWLDTEWHGCPRSIWLLLGLAVGIVVNLYLASLL